jgi:hypothetical protein
VLLDYDPTNEPKYTRTENVEADQRPAFVLPEGSSDFTRACPGARRLGTHTVLGRGAIRYACAASAGQDTAPKPEVISLDQATRLLLRQSGAGYTAEATEFELNPAVDADTFSTDLPAAGANGPAGPKIEDFRLPQIGGGELALADYLKALVIVTGSAAGIRKVLSRLLPLTHGGVKPPVIGMLIAVPSPTGRAACSIRKTPPRSSGMRPRRPEHSPCQWPSTSRSGWIPDYPGRRNRGRTDQPHRDRLHQLQGNTGQCHHRHGTDEELRDQIATLL